MTRHRFERDDFPQPGRMRCAECGQWQYPAAPHPACAAEIDRLTAEVGRYREVVANVALHHRDIHHDCSTCTAIWRSAITLVGVDPHAATPSPAGPTAKEITRTVLTEWFTKRASPAGGGTTEEEIERVAPNETAVRAAAAWLIADDTAYAAEPDTARRAAIGILSAALAAAPADDVERVAEAIAMAGTSHFGDDTPFAQQPAMTQMMRRYEARAAILAMRPARGDLREARRQGAEAMREAAAKLADERTRGSIIGIGDMIIALPLPEGDG